MKIVWPLKLLRRNLIVATAVLLLAAAAQGADVSFYAIYKSEKFNQADAGAAPVGKGHVVLYGNEVNWRDQPHGTFKLLFNGIYFGAAASTATSARPTEQQP